jgi:hypothetical protein
MQNIYLIIGSSQDVEVAIKSLRLKGVTVDNTKFTSMSNLIAFLSLYESGSIVVKTDMVFQFVAPLTKRDIDQFKFTVKKRFKIEPTFIVTFDEKTKSNWIQDLESEVMYSEEYSSFGVDTGSYVEPKTSQRKVIDFNMKSVPKTKDMELLQGWEEELDPFFNELDVNLGRLATFVDIVNSAYKDESDSDIKIDKTPEPVKDLLESLILNIGEKLRDSIEAENLNEFDNDDENEYEDD